MELLHQPKGFCCNLRTVEDDGVVALMAFRDDVEAGRITAEAGQDFVQALTVGHAEVVKNCLWRRLQGVCTEADYTPPVVPAESHKSSIAFVR